MLTIGARKINLGHFAHDNGFGQGTADRISTMERSKGTTIRTIVFTKYILCRV